MTGEEEKERSEKQIFKQLAYLGYLRRFFVLTRGEQRNSSMPMVNGIGLSHWTMISVYLNKWILIVVGRMATQDVHTLIPETLNMLPYVTKRILQM